MGPVRARIEQFLACRRLAFVGVSRRADDFSRAVFRELVHRGYDVVPVNENCGEIEGHPVAPSVAAIDPPVDWALIMTSAARAREAVEACHRAGIQRVWLHRGGGPGSVEPEALAYAERHGLEVVPGECPLMFLPDPGLVHRVHAFCKRVVGTYPG